ncbi:WecB/TagA/CpsF family glycosyltransferase [Pseudanabaenaceae cyanobacterium LEGE 13415]|nr:WecB/TagA/CpsF family glycosyltransferase [Pseudanabaenaceae cyanobacterium LEGE 13415]
MQNENVPIRRVIGCPVTALPFDAQISLILTWAKQRLSKTVCVANVHMLVEAYRNAGFATVLRQADLVTPDGMPLVWMLRCLGVSNQDRIAGMDILIALCEQAPSQNVSLFFLGSQDVILDRMKQRLDHEFPQLNLAGIEPLPFRPLTLEEDEALIQRINESGAGIVLVALGCPKQEAWIAQHRDRIHAVMIGLGGAFPVYAGVHKRAPRMVRSAGLEWLYRLVQEPRRLWGRYFDTIPIFVWLALRQLLSSSQDSPMKGES